MRDRILRFAAEEDERVILNPEALDDAREALAGVQRGLRDAFFDEAVSASPLWIIGTFHIFRYTLLPKDECLVALQEAAECCVPLYLRDPESVPVPIRSVIEEWAGHASTGDLIDHLADDAVRRLYASIAEGDAEGVDRALWALGPAVDAVPNADVRRSGYLCEMAVAMGDRYERTSDVAALDAALELIGQAEQAATEQTRYRIAAIKCSLLIDRHRADGNEEGIAEVIAIASRALRELPERDSQRLDVLWALSAAHEARLAATGDPRHLDEAIAAVREAAELSSDARRPALASLAVRLGDLLIDASRDLSRLADSASILEPSSPRRADVLWHLATRCQLRYHETNRPEYLDAMIDCLERALDPAIDGHPGRAAFHSGLGIALTSRFDHLGDVDDLNGSIAHGYQAMGTPAHDISVRPSLLRGLACSLRKRAELRRSDEDLDEAAAIGRLALDEADRLGVSSALILAELAAVAGVRYDLAGDVSDLENSCELGYRAVNEPASQGHESLPAMLSDLSYSLRTRYTVTGERHYLDEAVTIGRRAVDASLPGSVARVVCLHNLATALRNSYELRSAVGDLNDAIACWQEADRDGPDGNIHRGHVLNGLASGLFRRYQHPRYQVDPPAIGDLNSAIDYAHRAVQSPVTRVESRAAALSHLAGIYCERYRLSEDNSDLETAAALSRRALDEAPDNFPGRDTLLLNHIEILCAGGARDVDTAVELGRALAEKLIDADPRRARCLMSLAQALSRRGDLDDAVTAWRKAARITTAPAHVRAEAARAWGGALAMHGTGDVWQEALEAFTLAVELLPLIVWRGMDRVSQEDALDPQAMVACDAAACAIAAGRPRTAIELLEQGRTVLWGQWLGVRDAISELGETAPDLAERLETCREQLDRPVDGTELLSDSLLFGIRPPGRPDRDVEFRERAVAVWEETLAEVRRMPGYETFLLPSSFDRLRSAGSEGPVCVVNVSDIRTDVLAVGRDGVRVIPLPDVTYEDAVQHTVAHIHALHYVNGRSAERRDAVNTTIAWLWKSVVRPTLRALNAETDWMGARIWWCPTGPLTLLPLHASLYHADEHVISSYTPSLSMLIRARRPRRPTGDGPTRLLAVGIPDPPFYAADLPSLPGVAQELQAITERLDGGCRILLGEEASREEILRNLPSHAWAHFACHGCQDVERPSLGALYLHDAPLRVTEIGSLDLGNAELAYLSACDTGTGGVFLPDEAINMATAFHYAGYRHVVATQWRIRDDTAPEVASHVYRELSASGTLDSTEAARALDEVVRALACRTPGDPLVWAPYVHIGP